MFGKWFENTEKLCNTHWDHSKSKVLQKQKKVILQVNILVKGFGLRMSLKEYFYQCSKELNVILHKRFKS
jgi:hypothetical protein